MAFLSFLGNPAFWQGASAFGNVLGGVSGLLGAAGASGAQRAANRTQMEMAERQMQFQERMSSTAIQRQVKDAQKAGINPYYLIKGSASGASSPSGAMPTIHSAENPQAMSARMASLSMMSNTAKSVVDVMRNLQNIQIKDPAERVSRVIGSVFDKTRKSAKELHSKWVNRTSANLRTLVEQEVENAVRLQKVMRKYRKNIDQIPMFNR